MRHKLVVIVTVGVRVKVGIYLMWGESESGARHKLVVIVTVGVRVKVG